MSLSLREDRKRDAGFLLGDPLKFITTLQAATYITYNKRTREIIKMRLDPEWNKTVIFK
jgi:hypothetical protein